MPSVSVDDAVDHPMIGADRRFQGGYAPVATTEADADRERTVARLRALQAANDAQNPPKTNQQI